MEAKPVKPEAGMALSSVATSWGWLLHYAYRDPAEVYCSPVATHAEVLAMFPDAVAAEPIQPIASKPIAPMVDDDETAIRAWLDHIGETDPAIIADTLGKCRTDAEARAYFIEQICQLAGLADDRITCQRCANRRPYDGRCNVAAHDGQVIAERSYTPDATMMRRCEAYRPRPRAVSVTREGVMP